MMAPCSTLLPEAPEVTEPPANELDALIEAARRGDQDALQRFVTRVQPELRAHAAQLMRGERDDHTLQPTSLVNEAWLRLLGGLDAPTWENRRTFFTGAATAMRRVLVDHARRRGRDKRGGGLERVALEPVLDGLGQDPLARADLLDLHAALNEFSGVAPRAAQVVELRLFTGLTIAETAAMLEVSTSTVEADYQAARAWLRARLEEPSDKTDPRGDGGGGEP